jgi:hypothetical protein
MELDINFDEQVTSIDSVVLSIEIRQTQSGYSNYHFPLDIELEDSSGAIFNYTPYIKSDTTLKYIISNRIKDITFDKNNWLLVNIE